MAQLSTSPGKSPLPPSEHNADAGRQTIAIVGAGPAGLTAAYELLASPGKDLRVVVLEESEVVGGIARTAVHNGNRMDMGGHRFFSKVPEVNAWWDRMLPRQGAPAYDDKVLGRPCTLAEGGPDPETEDRVMLRRNRVSRILFNGKFFDYPISLKPATFANMGILTTAVAGCSYIKSALFKREENSLEDFYINRFGKKLYSMFFERYTENLWGRHPSKIDPSWGAQRVKGLSILGVLKNAIARPFRKKGASVETSLIEEFSYPKFGPGQLWETVAGKIRSKGGEILFGARVVGFRRKDDGRISHVVYEKDGALVEFPCATVVSSMPVKDLVAGLPKVPEKIAGIAAGLPYRDYMTVGVLVPSLRLRNQTKIRTLGGIVPDNWVYVHDRSVKMGRFQIYNNWSPYMVASPEKTVWIGLEYFCNEGDSLWAMSDEDFSRLAIHEMVTLGLIASEDEAMDTHVERVKKAYPAYFDTYAEFARLREWLDGIPNLFCVGRNGQHRYNNIDHSMCTAFEAAKAILAGSSDRAAVWNVNTEKQYHETR